MPKSYTPAQVKIFKEKLGLTDAEIDKLLKYDKAVEKGEKTPHDLTPAQEKVASQMRRANRKPTVIKFDKRERKPNATKGGIIAALAIFLGQTSEFSTENIEITNKERQIRFESAGETFELTLVQKRKPKK